MLRRRIAGSAIENFDLTMCMIGDRLRASSCRFFARLWDGLVPSHRLIFAMRASRKSRSSESYQVCLGERELHIGKGDRPSEIVPAKLRLALLAALLVMVITGAGPLAAAPVPQGSTPATVRVGGDVKPPLKTKNVAPVYPPIAVASHTEGVVILEITIGTDGKVKDAKVVRSIKTLDDAAIDAVRRWEFKPTVIDGKPVQVIMTVPVNFTLN